MVTKIDKNSLIDMNLMHLIFGNNALGMQDFLKMLIKTATEKFDQIAHDALDRNAEAVLNSLHQLKGPVGSSGFMKLYKLCEHMEDQVKDADWEKLSVTLDHSRKMVDKLNHEMIKKFNR
ncbi:MAG: Hpt domain-containing protein [Gammaproteobacteria bacterium]|nr:Hpt domain-containing protein [Gammaproteobacteria bacterium]